MPIRPDLLNEIAQTLGTALVPNFTAASDACDLFEAYVFTLVLRAAQAEQGAVTFQNVDGTAPTTFTFRTSPGHIWSRNRQYTHAVVTFPNKPVLEAHTGIYVTGTSQVMHEADVLVVRRDEAETCRQGRADPRYRHIALTAECKFYATTLPLHLARGFLGLCSDFSGKEAYFVTNTQAASVERLLSHKRKKWDHQVVPQRQGNVTRLINLLQDTFKNFKART